MELLDGLRTTAAIRQFTDEPVSDDTLWRVLDAARFGPSGSNQQGWHVVAVRDPSTKAQLRDLYLDGWYEYRALVEAGLRPWAPGNDRVAEQTALGGAAAQRAAAAELGGGFAEHLDRVPVLVTVWVDLGAVAAIDRDADRYTFAGGASVYPFVWSLLLAARAEGLGGVLTTILIRRESEAAALLGAGANHALAAMIPLGYPQHVPTKLRRNPVESFATIDHFGGPPVSPG